MKILLANKQTEEQKRPNEFARYQFILAMMNLDERMILALLKKDARFMGHMNNWQFISWLAKQFEPLKTSLFSSEFKDGISLDAYPGSEIFEFSFSSFDQDSMDEDSFSGNINEFNKPRQTEKVVICLVLLFENGKIADVRTPKKIICPDQTKRFQNEN